jgi:hypothetical protein
MRVEMYPTVEREQLSTDLLPSSAGCGLGGSLFV